LHISRERERERESKSYLDGGNAVSSKKLRTCVPTGVEKRERERERESKSYVDGGNAVSSKKLRTCVPTGVEKSNLSESTLVLPISSPRLIKTQGNVFSEGQFKSLHMQDSDSRQYIL
jgi:hypothetical protein